MWSLSRNWRKREEDCRPSCRRSTLLQLRRMVNQYRESDTGTLLSLVSNNTKDRKWFLRANCFETWNSSSACWLTTCENLLNSLGLYGTILWLQRVIWSGRICWTEATCRFHSTALWFPCTFDSVLQTFRRWYNSCDGIYLNYNWDDAMLLQSADFGVISRIFVGIDCFARGCIGVFAESSTAPRERSIHFQEDGTAAGPLLRRIWCACQ